MALNRGCGVSIEIEEKVCNGVWQLIMEDALVLNHRRHLVKVWWETDFQETISGGAKEEDDSLRLRGCTGLAVRELERRGETEN